MRERCDGGGELDPSSSEEGASSLGFSSSSTNVLRTSSRSRDRELRRTPLGVNVGPSAPMGDRHPDGVETMDPFEVVDSPEAWCEASSLTYVRNAAGFVSSALGRRSDVNRRASRGGEIGWKWVGGGGDASVEDEGVDWSDVGGEVANENVGGGRCSRKSRTELTRGGEVKVFEVVEVE